VGTDRIRVLHDGSRQSNSNAVSAEEWCSSMDRRTISQKGEFVGLAVPWCAAAFEPASGRRWHGPCLRIGRVMGVGDMRTNGFDHALAALALCLAVAGPTAGQEGGDRQPARAAVQSQDLPHSGTLEGLPKFRVDLTPEAAKRRELDVNEAQANPLRVRVKDGQFYWESRGNRLLKLDSSGPYTYLSSGPGNYIRLTKLNDHFAYVEHVELKDFGSVTWWGELRVILGQ
jgi:hypothetical protein